MTCRRLIAISVLTALLLASPGCAHFSLKVAEPNPGDEYEQATMHTFFWGFYQDNEIADTCKSNALDEVRVTTNLGYSFVSLVTLGIWVPIEIRWKCRKPALSEGEF